MVFSSEDRSTSGLTERMTRTPVVFGGAVAGCAESCTARAKRVVEVRRRFMMVVYTTNESNG